MAHCDNELQTVYTFLNELSLDEIIQYDNGVGKVSVDDTDEDNWSSTLASSVTGSTTDESSDNEDFQQFQRPANKRTKSPSQRVRQRVYDKKCRYNKKERHLVNCNVFLPIVQQFVSLLHSRVAATEREIGLRCLAKKNGDQIPVTDAHKQLELNRGALACIHKCTSSWETQRRLSGKFFMRDLAREIDLAMETLGSLEKQLSVVTVELQWRLHGKTGGVWV